jgi:glucose/arabinose dehydrogenase
MLCGLAFGAFAGCGSDTARLAPAASEGPYPQLPEPNKSLIPTVQIAPAKGWPEGKTPTAAAGLRVGAFASGLNHPRWLLVLPNGDVLVAETNAPERPEDGKGIKGTMMKAMMAQNNDGRTMIPA